MVIPPPLPKSHQSQSRAITRQRWIRGDTHGDTEGGVIVVGLGFFAPMRRFRVNGQLTLQEIVVLSIRAAAAVGVSRGSVIGAGYKARRRRPSWPVINREITQSPSFVWLWRSLPWRCLLFIGNEHSQTGRADWASEKAVCSLFSYARLADALRINRQGTNAIVIGCQLTCQLRRFYAFDSNNCVHRHFLACLQFAF